MSEGFGFAAFKKNTIVLVQTAESFDWYRTSQVLCGFVFDLSKLERGNTLTPCSELQAL